LKQLGLPPKAKVITEVAPIIFGSLDDIEAKHFIDLIYA
jgi:hypothetical protein